ncbi:MAG: 3-hydroxyacyl-CoA dehydrogenase [Coriobacteriia bacterium]|nr:3-hydroxyacyl-CoA dehydrogenase [Coriobacteriia bacterium]
MDFKNVTLAGAGVLGSQIAFQIAYSGFDVSVWVRSDASAERAQAKFDRLKNIYLDRIDQMAAGEGRWSNGIADQGASKDELLALKDKVEAAHSGLKIYTDMAEAVKDADLVIEAVAENPEQKIEFYTQLAPLLKEDAILASNSSTLLPSTFAKYTGRPEKFLMFHFANEIYTNNTAEVMGHDGTSQEAFDAMVEFAKAIRMVPLEVLKEQPGYILNTMLSPFLSSAMYLWSNDIAHPHTVDKTWELATGAPKGPFKIIDIVGLTTVRNIAGLHPDAKTEGSIQNVMVKKLTEMLDAGKSGIIAGEGFYKYVDGKAVEE